MKRRFCVVLLVLLAFFALASGAQAAAGGVYVEAAVGQEAPAVVRPQTVKGYNYLFLPASTDLSALVLHFDGGTGTLSGNGGTLDVKSGEAFDLTALFQSAPSDGVYKLELRSAGTVTALRVMVSANTASLFLTSDNPTSKGRNWIEQSKDNKTSGKVCMLSPDGEVIYAGGLKQIKGRGNTTWKYYPKKPYQIKLSTSADLMENGESAGTWVLLANYIDESLLHNRFTYDLALDLELAYSPHCRPVDLYYDGEYRGSYLLSEKTEVKSNRVEVEDLEKAIEKANPDIDDFDKLSKVQGSTPTGKPCQYVSGIALPGDYSGGYLLELDYKDRAQEEASWFSSSSGIYFTVKSPEYLPKAAMDYISSAWQEFEDALRAGGENPKTWKPYTEYADVTSLAKIYLIEELSQDVDAFLSSCFFYKDAGDGLIYAGPVWDFDSCYGSYSLTPAIDQPQAGTAPLGRMLQSVPSFRREVRRCWEEMYPLLRQYTSGQGAHSISAYGKEIAASQRMDAVIWPQAAPADYSAALSNFRSYVNKRAEWMDKTIRGWTIFTDVSTDKWYSDAVTYVSDRGLFSGTSTEMFSPNELMTRGMIVTVLHRLAGTPAPDGEVSFSDVDENAWYGRAAAWAASAGIATDFGDGSFRPYEPVSRQELVTLFYRFAEARGADMSTAPIPDAYVDRDSIDDSAADAFAWAIHHGIIVGTSDNELSPLDSVSRAQIAVICQRFDKFLGK